MHPLRSLPIQHHPQRRLPILLAISVLTAGALLATATPIRAQQPFTHRLTGVAYDFDNNGTPDATTTITYDASGHPIDVVYTYTDDGTPDAFNTEDDDAASETTVLGYDANDRLITSDFDRVLMPSGSESEDTTYTFTGGELTRFDTTGILNGVASAFYGDLTYVSGSLSSLAVRDASDDSIVLLHSYTNGSNGLPEAISFIAGVSTDMTLSWRPDGQLDDLSATTTFAGSTFTGTADYLYAANGQIEAEAWTSSPGFGAPYAEFAGRTYRKTYSYDAQLLKTLEQIDIGYDGSVEATRTFTWTAGPCVPAFIYAPNGRPNFAEMNGFPYKPGTGAMWLENCGPYLAGSSPPPVPGLGRLGWALLMATMLGVGGLAMRRLAARGDLRA